VVLLDQGSKAWVLADLQGPRRLLGPLGLALGTNTGIAFSLLSGRGTVLTVVLTAVAIAVGWALWRSTRRSEALALGLILGGAVGNLADRSFRRTHAVVDFLTLPHWATFNLADSAITVGTIWLGLVVLLGAPSTEARSG